MALSSILFLYRIQLSFCVACFNGFTLVVFVFTPCKADDNLRKTPLVDEHPQTHNRDTLILRGSLQLGQFTPREEQLTVPARCVVVEVAPIILGDIHPSDEEFVVGKIAIAVHQRRLAQAKRF